MLPRIIDNIENKHTNKAAIGFCSAVCVKNSIYFISLGLCRFLGDFK